ncbi:MAG: hypothetical protein ACXWT0_00200 [Methylobacter sp.]
MNKESLKIINSNFAFQPDIGLADAWLYIQGAEIPVLLNDEGEECVISIQETEDGAAKKIAESMRMFGKFNAVFYEGIPLNHTSKQALKCEFVRCIPTKRDWKKRKDIVIISVVLHIKHD